MKYRFDILLVFLSIIAITGASAQKITGGLKVGMNLATMSSFEDEMGDAVGYRMAFCGGGFAAFALGDIIVIQPELLFSQKGVKAEETVFDETYIVTYKLPYLEIPLFFKMVMPIQGKVKPNFFVGPYFGVMITTPRVRTELDGMSAEVDFDYMEDIDLGVVFGGGVDFGLGKGKIVFDVRYGLGLTTVFEREFLEEGMNISNRAFSFLVGYSF